MSCCCQKIFVFCDSFSVCGNLNTNIPAPASGVYTLVLDFLGTTLEIEADIVEDEDIIFPLDNLNENYKYTGWIKDITGERLFFIIETISYDCISFEANIRYKMNDLP